jgi:hypothetical protein
MVKAISLPGLAVEGLHVGAVGRRQRASIRAGGEIE